jgi:hypothetical protein
MLRSSAALVALATSLYLAEPLAAQDPWARVPAFPTACYDNETPGFGERVSVIRHEITVVSDRQAAINSAIKQKLNDLDVSKQQANMMAFMTKNPAKAGAVMQEIALAGQKQQQVLQRFIEMTGALSEQLKAAEAEYARENDALSAIQIEWSKVAPAPGAPGDPVRARQLAARHDAEYARMCAKYLVSESSPFLKYLADLKNYLITEKIPGDGERARYENLQFELNAIPSAEFKPTGIYAAVTEYLDGVQKVFARRHSVPLSGR